MKKPIHIVIPICALAATLTLATASLAKTSPDDMAKLEGPLTPMGAERAGNADGTIPAWTGKWLGAPPDITYKQGDRFPDPYASDKPLFTITAQNMQQYAARLTDGEKALLKKYPDTFKITVYPSHRDFRYPDEVYKAIRTYAPQTTMTPDQNGLKDFPPVAPFPVPKDGVEAMWNLRFASLIECESATYDQAVVYPDGNIARGKVNYFIYGPRGAIPFQPASNPLVNKTFARVQTQLPLSDRGSLIVSYDMWNEEGSDTRRAWQYNPGTRRVRQMPEYGFDQPIGPGGFRTVDDDRLFNGSGERYDWKILGKREIYIPYDNYKLMDPSIKYSDLLTKGHENMQYMRFELHRVWVLQATLKAGFRHQYAKRVLYLDEDSWNAVAADNYDARGTLWRMNLAPTLYAYDAKSFYSTSVFYHDLISGAYYADRLSNQEEMPILTHTSNMTEAYFSPDSIRGDGN
ncbi:DUF1329 domain-containing protein [Paraburkholderia oxyphila]|uniref:DUF1329 domain-containing protein n=1 Tax=Paraburkholderia oxyphila TaxID=614212 RepID=UPI00048836F4|nr:DUF1329 domain-containing protein [Paraburkholderia oxyphila]